VARQRAAPLVVLSGGIQFQRAGDVYFIDPQTRFLERADGLRNVFEFDSLMTDVVTEAEVPLGGFQRSRPSGMIPEALEEGDRLGGGLDQAVWLGFDGQSDQAAGFSVQPIESRGCIQQARGAAVEMTAGMRKLLECERHCGDASLNSLVEQN